MSREVVAILTHRMDESIAALYRSLKACEFNQRSVRLLWHVDDQAAAPAEGIDERDLGRFTGADIARLGLRLLQGTLVPGCQHFPLYVELAAGRLEADYVWLIEHDVRYAGNWRELFDYFGDCRDDLLCSHILDHAACPKWYWWPVEFRGAGPQVVIEPRRRLRGFLPVMRLSRAALEALYEWQRSGWRGHSEVLIPTLLHHYGYRLRDIGGDGPFVLESERNRFYLGSIRDESGGVFESTMRYRPAFVRWGDTTGKLYHPVKSKD